MTFIPQYEPLIKESYANAVHEQIMSGWLGPGEKVKQFEDKICEITGAEYTIATTSGTVALYLSILTLCNKPGKIYFPNYTFLAGAHAAKLANKQVELVDIKDETLCMNPVILDQVLDHTDPTFLDLNLATIYVNHNGYVGSDRYKIRELCNDYEIPMIEDSSQALGIYDENGLHAGRVGDVGIFSFSVPKIVTTGQGGCIITDNAEIATKCRQLLDQGGDWKKTKVHNNLGGNFKFNDILAAYGLAQLEIIDELLERRRQVFDYYRKHLNIIDFGYDSTWMVLYRTKKAIEIIEKLKEIDIQAVQYYNPIHTNPSCKGDVIHNKWASEEAAQEIVYLPSSLTLKKETVKIICEIIQQVENNV